MSSLTDSNIASFQAFTGASAPEATMFLEMAGGNNVSLAVELYFGNGSGGGFSDSLSDSTTNTNATTSSAKQNPDWYNIIWGDNMPSLAWTEQALTFDASSDDIPYSQLGLVQNKNGPCGVLALLNAVILSQHLNTNTATEFTPPTDDLLAAAIATLLAAPHRNSSSQVQCPMWDDECPGGVNFIAKPNVIETKDFVLSHLDHFTRPGGILLICYAAVVSRGIQQVQSDVTASGGELPLIFGTFNLCTSELMSLLMRGSADGNVGSYGLTGGSKIDWGDHTCDVGMLSYNEIDHSIPVCDKLKSPTTPIWLLHGRDHFTFLFLVSKEEDQKEEEEDDTSSSSSSFSLSGERKSTSTDQGKGAMCAYEMYHYNGLPPNGPRMTKVSFDLPSGKKGIVGPAPNTHEEGVVKFRTPVPNTIYDIVQAHQMDKKQSPKKWKEWRYEVVLHVSDPNGKLYGKGSNDEQKEEQNEEQKEDTKPEEEEEDEEEANEGSESGSLCNVYSQSDGEESEDGRWRCSTCYVKRNETFAFKLNECDSMKCMHCGEKKEDCGWTKWMTYEELTVGWQRSMDRRNQPKIVTLLGTKWRGVHNVKFDNVMESENPPSI